MSVRKRKSWRAKSAYGIDGYCDPNFDALKLKLKLAQMALYVV